MHEKKLLKTNPKDFLMSLTKQNLVLIIRKEIFWR